MAKYSILALSIIVLVLGNLLAVLTMFALLDLDGGSESHAKQEPEESFGLAALQLADLPSAFKIDAEQFYSRDEFIQGLPAAAQPAQEGLRYAFRRSFLSDGASNQQVDVLVFSYDSSKSAENAQESFSDDGFLEILKRLNGGRELLDFEAGFGWDNTIGDGAVTAQVIMNPYSNERAEAYAYSIRLGSLRAELAVIIQPSVYFQPDDLARNQAQRMEYARSSLE